MPNALILAPDWLPQGIYTIPRGEGRWTLNIAELLAQAGYETDIIELSEPVLEAEYKDKQPAGINWSTLTLEQAVTSSRSYDVYFCHFPIYIENPKIFSQVQKLCKKFLFGTWWPESTEQWPIRWGIDQPSNSAIITPFRGYKGQTSTVYPVPLGHIDKFEESKFSNRTIVWTAKRPMTNDRGNPKFRTNLFHLQATLRLAKEGYKTKILCGGKDFIFNTPDAPPVKREYMAEATETYQELRSLQSVEFHDYMPLDRFLEHIRSGSITCPLDGSSAIPHTPLYGVVPVMFTDWGMNFTSNSTLEKLGAGKAYENFTFDEVYTRMLRLLTDEVFYNSQLKILRTECPYYETHEAVQMLKDALGSIK